MRKTNEDGTCKDCGFIDCSCEGICEEEYDCKIRAGDD